MLFSVSTNTNVLIHPSIICVFPAYPLVAHYISYIWMESIQSKQESLPVPGTYVMPSPTLKPWLHDLKKTKNTCSKAMSAWRATTRCTIHGRDVGDSRPRFGNTWNTRWWSYNYILNIWPYKWVTGVITPVRGVNCFTLLISVDESPPCIWRPKWSGSKSHIIQTPWLKACWEIRCFRKDVVFSGANS